MRLQAGGLAGQIEGVVSSLGLLYTTFAQGGDSVMVPNNVVLSAAVVPLREPASVDLRARLRPDVKPSDVQAMLEQSISTPVRGEPTIALEEIDADEVVVRIHATPLADADGPRLADEVLAAVAAADPKTTTSDRGARGGGRGAWRAGARSGARLRRRRRASTRARAARRGAARTAWPRVASPSRRRARLALVRAGRARIARRSRPRRSGAGPRRRARGDEASTAPARSGSGATSSSARLDSIAFTTARATSSGRLVPTPGGSLAPDSANMPASRMKPGEDHGDADALGREVLAQGQGEAAQPELRRRVDRACRARPRGPRART